MQDDRFSLGKKARYGIQYGSMLPDSRMAIETREIIYFI